MKGMITTTQPEKGMIMSQTIRQGDSVMVHGRAGMALYIDYDYIPITWQVEYDDELGVSYPVRLAHITVDCDIVFYDVDGNIEL